MLDLAQLIVLKDKLINGSDFSEVFRFFLDHFGENPEFHDIGELVPEHPLLLSMIEQIGRTMFKQNKLRLVGLHLARLNEYPFIHGGFFINGKVATILYFEEINKGLMAVSWGGDEMRYSRFTAQKAVGLSKPSRN